MSAAGAAVTSTMKMFDKVQILGLQHTEGTIKNVKKYFPFLRH